MFCPRWGLHMGNDLTEMQKKSSRVNGLLSLVMLGFSIAAVIGNRGVPGLSGFVYVPYLFYLICLL